MHRAAIALLMAAARRLPEGHDFVREDRWTTWGPLLLLGKDVAGATLELWYKNHIEANYVIEGTGELTNLETGEVYPVGPGFMYTLDQHDRHRMHTHTAMRIICVFNPAVVGIEKHDADGSYPLL